MKRIIGPFALLTVLALAGLVAGVGRGDGGGDAEGESELRRGFAIAPLPLNLAHKNRHLIGLGSYIVNAQGGCNDCHTNPPYAMGGNPYLGEPKQINTNGYLKGGMSFGPFVSRNIRPNPVTGLPANLTFNQFQEVIRHGTDFDSPTPRLLQVMPWPVYQEMTEQDIRAIYEYLRALPPAP